MLLIAAAAGRCVLRSRSLHTAATAAAAVIGGAEEGLQRRYSNLDQLEADAKHLLTPQAYGYYASGSDDQWTLRENKAALQRYRLLPRMLVDVSQVDTSTTLLGQWLASPILFAPMAQQRLCHPDGELAMARAAAACGLPYVLSTMATASIQEVSDAVAAPSPAGGAPEDAAWDPNLWFQIYVLKRRDVTEMMVQEATRLGYRALVVTVDAPRLGNREADERNRFSLPPHLSLKNLELITKAAGTTEGVDTDGSKFGRHFSDLFDQQLTWEFLPWLKQASPLPVVLKGILSPDDARRAVQLGADGIILSNHGGRQLNFAPAAVDMLPSVAEAVGGRVPLLVDGGITRGTDVIKCLALGASAVLVGRPLLWALTLGGQRGVEEAAELLRYELELSMALLGVQSVGQISSDFIIPPRGGHLHIPPARR
ncbi:hypothetical protein ABPG77_009240 [Micractinium sp. CCAP 211/92]